MLDGLDGTTHCRAGLLGKAACSSRRTRHYDEAQCRFHGDWEWA